MIWAWIAGALILLALFGVYLSMTAGRLDALHKRIDTSTLTLDAQLLRRSSVALELATCGLLDPAEAMVLSDAAHNARTTTTDGVSAPQRWVVESNLTDILSVTLDDEEVAAIRDNGEGVELLDELIAAATRVELATRFLNEAVRACVQLRRQRMVRWFHLAGHTPWPQAVEMDVAVPESLGEG